MRFVHTATTCCGKRSYKNAFATDFTISKDNVEQIVANGRDSCKIENEFEMICQLEKSSLMIS